MENAKQKDIYGRCYCGSVRFSIAAGTKPHWAGYCHCKDCRQANAAPLYQYIYVKKQYFQIIEGKQLLRWYTRADPNINNLKRFFCERCGSKVFNSVTAKKADRDVELCGTFPSLFDDPVIATSATWSPRMHVHSDQSFMDLSLLQDDLPRH
ncbi:MAG: GFA family protein [Acidiferrobacterales bacterium]|nr:GFA family protein [Acidiferrobacterales bacterium]